MSRPMVTVRLHGPLGDKYGREFLFAARTSTDCVAALCGNFPQFRAEFCAPHQEWAFLCDGDWRYTEEAMSLPISRSVDICPVVNGQAFLGAALITFLIPGITGWAATALGGLLVAGLLFGVSMFLSPKPKTKTSEDGKKTDSYTFGGPENVTQQGGPVPVVYGDTYVGSVVISAAIETSDIPINGGSTYSVTDQPALRARALPGMNRSIDAPDGWTFVGEQSVLIGERYEVLALFISPDGQQVWDEQRGSLPIREGWL